jgi:hypothetical protein
VNGDIRALNLCASLYLWIRHRNGHWVHEFRNGAIVSKRSV